MTPDPLILDLLPRLYRRRDADGALRALTEVLDASRRVIQDDIDALYRDWFVATCDLATLPLLAGLVGLNAVPADAADPRALVADAVAMARRKGTYPAAARMLELLGGWPAIVRPDADVLGRVVAEIWRQPADRLTHVAPSVARDGGAGCYRIHPLGVDCRLLAPARLWRDPWSLPDRRHDAPVSLHEAADPAGGITIHLRDARGQWRALPPGRITFADLGDWSPDNRPSEADASATVDANRGRLCLAGFAGDPDDLLVSFTYAAPGAVGGGGYPRPEGVETPAVWMADVVHGTATAADAPRPRYATLREAVEAWRSARGDGVIWILDGAAEDVTGLELDDRTHVCADDPNRARRLTIAAPAGDVAILRGDIVVRGHGVGHDLTLRGLWIDGGLAIGPNAVARLEHCTVGRPQPRLGGRPAIVVRDAGLTLHRCVTGSIEVGAHATLAAAEGIVDGTLVGEGAATLRAVTVLGEVEVGRIDAADTLFDGGVATADGLFDHCAARRSVADLPTHDLAEAWAGTYGGPGYARLPDGSPLLAAGSDGAEIGAFQTGRRRQREALVTDALDDLVPVGTDVVIAWR